MVVGSVGEAELRSDDVSSFLHEEKQLNATTQKATTSNRVNFINGKGF
jgi:hypothetical protein